MSEVLSQADLNGQPLPDLIHGELDPLAVDDFRAFVAGIVSHRKLATDLGTFFIHAMQRCGLGLRESIDLIGNSKDPVQTLLYYAGANHNFARLVVEETFHAHGGEV